MGKEIDKIKLIEVICDWYGFNLKIINDKVTIFDSERKFKYNNIDEALKDWLETLEESNADRSRYEEEYYLWDKETIDFIKSIK